MPPRSCESTKSRINSLEEPPPKTFNWIVSRFEKISLWCAVALGLASLGLSWLGWRESQAANRHAARSDVQVTAARVPVPPTVGDRVVVDLRLQNMGVREKSKITITIHVSGQPGVRIQKTKGITHSYDGTVGPSDSLWVAAVTSNEWASGDDPRELSIFGLLTYFDSVTGSTMEQPICLVTPGTGSKPADSSSLMVECAAVPPPKPLRPSGAVSLLRPEADR